MNIINFNKYNPFIELPATAQSKAKRKKVFNVGINDADYITSPNIGKTKVFCPFYDTWRQLLMNYGATIAQENNNWCMLSKFTLWMEQKDWHNRNLSIIDKSKKLTPDNFEFIPKHRIRIPKNKLIYHIDLDSATEQFALKVAVDNLFIFYNLYHTIHDAAEVVDAITQELALYVEQQNLLLSNQKTDNKQTLKETNLQIAIKHFEFTELDLITYLDALNVNNKNSTITKQITNIKKLYHRGLI